MAEFRLMLVWVCCVYLTEGDNTFSKITIRNTTTITSPNYPRHYPPNTTIVWVLRDNDGIGKWELNFVEDIKIENSKSCMKDHLEIIEKEDPKSRLCGHIKGLPARTSNGSEMTLIFRSDRYIEDRGFKIKIIHHIDRHGLHGRTAYVIEDDLDEPFRQPIFIALATILAVTVLVFVCLLVCLIIGIHNKRRRQYRTNPQSYIGHIQFTNPAGSNIQLPKRYSRPSITDRQDGHPLPLTHKTSTSSRGPLLSSGSTRYS